MSYNISDFPNIVRSFLISQISNKYPGIDTTVNSVFDDLYTKPNIEALEPFLDAVNLSDIIMDLSNAELINDDVLESIGYNNYNLTRSAGTKATTTLTISFTRVSETDPVTIPTGTTFYTEDDIGFQTTSNYSFSAAEMLNSYDAENVLYTINVQVTALEAGSEYNVAANQISKFPSTISSFVESVSNKEDVTNGVDQESKQDYADRLKKWYTTRHIGTTPGYEADVLDVLPGISDTKVVGKNEPEMTRDLFTVVLNGNQKQIHIGGKTDIYIKGSRFEQRYINFEAYTGKILVQDKYSKINMASIAVLNLTEPTKTVFYTTVPNETADTLIISIQNNTEQSYTESNINTINIKYKTTDNIEVSKNYTCGKMQFTLEVPFYEITGFYETSDTTKSYNKNIIMLTRKDILDNVIDSTSTYYLSSQESVTANVISTVDILNGTALTLAYTINASVASLRDHYEAQKNRLTGSDVLIKEASKHYINMKIAVKLKEKEELTESRKIQIENAIADYISSLKIGELIKESEIVKNVSVDSSVSTYLLYIKLPFVAFYTPANVNDAITETRISDSVITPNTTSYIVLNKIEIIGIS